MEFNIKTRLVHAWNAFMNRDPTYQNVGPGYSLRPDRPRLGHGNERSIVSSIFNRIALDVATIDIKHCRLDSAGRFIEEIDSGINRRLNFEANIDQSGRAFLHDIVLSMFDEGAVAIVPVDTSFNPKISNSFSIDSVRTGKIIEWYPKHVKVRIYNDRRGEKEDILLPKSQVGIIENPLYAIVNEPNSTLQRLMRKLSLLDATDEKTASGKLDLIIQLPYVAKTQARREQAERRRNDMEDQLTNSKYGVAYIDGTEKVIQLNRSLENNLLKQVEYWTNMLYSQLGITQAVLDGTADEQTMLNYNNRTVEPIVAAIADELKRKFLTKTARSQGQSIKYFRDPFRLVPVNNIAEIADKFTRNEIMTSNEIRQIVGMKPADDPKADELRNSNISQSKQEAENAVPVIKNEERREEKVKMDNCDFSGYATRNNLLCGDGVTIRKDAFKGNDGCKVPLVWNHEHNDPSAVLGHAVLENRDDGVYAYGVFNDTEQGQTAKKLVQNGDVRSLSIWANQLKKIGKDVVHGNIRELSLVLAGANPGAYVDFVMAHSAEGEEEMEVSWDENIMLYHSVDTEKKGENKVTEETKKPETSEGSDDKTIKEVLDTMNDEQKKAMYAVLGMTLSDDEDDDEKGGNVVKHNIFDNEEREQANKSILSHSDEMKIVSMAKQSGIGSLRAAMNIFAEENADTLAHGVFDDEVEKLFPEYELLKKGEPETLTRDQSWIDAAMAKIHKSPYTRIKTRQADARIAELKAKGYQKKGDYKKEMAKIKLLSRTTDPQTVYIKDTLQRDDIVDIIDFDVVAYQWNIMRQTLNEELIMAALVGDGREDGDPDKIHEDHIRSIWNDNELYTIHQTVDFDKAKQELQGSNTGANFGENYIKAEAILTASLYAREKYKGSGSLDFYCTPHLLNVMLLARDLNGRRIYDSKDDLAAALNINSIVTVEQFEGLERTDSETNKHKLLGLFVNLGDYQFGAAKGGEVSKFDNFDIDFNQYKYLLETRLSGSLTKVYSAIALEENVA